MQSPILLLTSVLAVIVVYIVIIYLYLRLMRQALLLAGPEHRNIEPGMLWLLFFPIVNLAWNVVISLQVANALTSRLQKLGGKIAVARLRALAIGQALSVALALYFSFSPNGSQQPLLFAAAILAYWLIEVLRLTNLIKQHDQS